MIKVILLITSLVVAAFLGSLITGIVCYRQWQETRCILENTYLQTAYPTKDHSLGYFTDLLEREINNKGSKKIEFLYADPNLKHKMSITDTNIEGTTFFALDALEHTYGCYFEFAESSVIVRQASTR